VQTHGIIVGIRVPREDIETFLRFDVKSGRRGNFARSLLLREFLLRGLLLLLEDTRPVSRLLFIKLFFPLGFRVRAIKADMAAFVASGTVATLQIVIELTLRFGGNFVAINHSFEVWTLKALR
jgi:hypothetical protein